MRIRVEGTHIYVNTVGELLPKSEIRFFAKDSDVTVEFLKNAKGLVTGVILNPTLRYMGKKVE